LLLSAATGKVRSGSGVGSPRQAMLGLEMQGNFPVDPAARLIFARALLGGLAASARELGDIWVRSAVAVPHSYDQPLAAAGRPADPVRRLYWWCP